MNALYVYVLSEVAWDYNDEYYTSSDSNAGIPILVSKREDLLLERARTLTIAKLKTCCLADYYSGWDSQVRYLCESADVDFYDYSGEPLPEDVVEKIYKLDPSHFYRVDKVELY